MISANPNNLEVAGVPFRLDGADLGNDVMSVLDELGHHYFGERYSDANGNNTRIVPDLEVKPAPDSKTKQGSFLAELKRRDVYKVAIAYIVAGWALSQGIAQVFPVFDVPNWTIRLIFLLIIIGLPIALVLAWIFELTPQGIKRTTDVSSDAAADVVRQFEARARQEFIRGYLFALVYAGLGDKEKAIDYLKREYLNHDDGGTMSTRVDSMFDPPRGDPGFVTLADKTLEVAGPSQSTLS